MTRHRSALLAAALAAAIALPCPAAASPGDRSPVCVIVEDGAPVDAAALDTALVIERRKSGAAFAWIVRDAAAGCPDGPGDPGDRLEVGRFRVRLVQEGRTRMDFPIGPVPAPDRPAEIARRTVDALADPGGTRRPVPLGDGALPGRTGHPARPAEAAGTTAGYVSVGGRYAWQREPDRHAGGADVEAGASWWGGRLALGATIGWLPPAAIRSGTLDVSGQAVAAGVVLRGGGFAGPVLLRAGLGVGADWEQVIVRPRTAREHRTATSVLPFVDGEAECLVPFAGRFHASLAASVRGHLRDVRYAWNGIEAHRSPRVSIGAVLRLGVSFGGGAR